MSKSKGFQAVTDESHKRKRGEESKSSSSTIKEEDSSDMELCWSDSDNEEECKPRKRLNFEGLESYLSKHIKSEEKTMKLEQDEFKVDVYQSFLPTTSTANRTEENNRWIDVQPRQKEGDILKDNDPESKQVFFSEKNDNKESQHLEPCGSVKGTSLTESDATSKEFRVQSTSFLLRIST